LPFFAAFSMPDVFAGYVAMGEVLLLAFWDRLAWSERIVITLMVGLAITFHTTHLFNSALVLLMAALAFRLLKAPKGVAATALGAVALAMVGAFLAVGAYKEGVKLKTGDELRRPPFLAMRVLADGPGREYLRASCDKGAHWALCPFRALPLDNSQDLLWSDDRKKGIFNVTTLPTRLKMEQEETRFVLNSVLYDPVGQVVASVENWGEQLSMYYVDDPIKNPHYYLTNDYWSTTNLPLLINRAHDCGRDHWGCGFRLTIDGSIWLHGVLLALGLIVIGWRLSRRDIFSALRRGELAWNSDAARLAMALGLLVGVTLMNGFVCGALSGPFPRYQARITWIISAGAAVAVISMIPALAAIRWRVLPERLLGLPVVADLRRRIDMAFLRFGMVGAAGFVVDYGVLHLATQFGGLNPYAGRFVSFPMAVVATWLLNRTFTFRHATAHGPVRQALTYLAVQCVGGAANIATYSAALAFARVLKDMLVIPLGFGCIAGLFLNFLGSKHIAFKAAAPAPAASVEAVETGR
ncbi:MAG: GtrA family protein, partial [Caulobacteraceae bacterium]|nr:GtrA family protein [Caulobacteraceae bacterium]